MVNLIPLHLRGSLDLLPNPPSISYSMMIIMRSLGRRRGMTCRCRIRDIRRLILLIMHHHFDILILNQFFIKIIISEKSNLFGNY
jgi:hypothetical protein